MAPESNYRRIVRLVEEKIRSGEYPPGHRLPAERELCTIFGVSRITARQAMTELAHSKLVIRRQGQGTFVAETKVNSSLLGFFSLSEALKAQGLLVATRVVTQGLVTPTVATATTLGLAPGEKVFELVRVRLLDGEPLALETSELSARRFPGLDRGDFGARSLYGVLRSDYGVQLAHARETLEPILPSREEMQLLGQTTTAPAILLLRTTFDAGETAVEVARAIIRGDRCRLVFELWADQRTRSRGGPVPGLNPLEGDHSH